MKITTYIQDLLAKAVEELGLPVDSELDIHLEHPADLNHGDYATNLAMIAYRNFAKQMDSHVPGGRKDPINWSRVSNGKVEFWKSPRELAQALVKKINDKEGYIEKVEIAGPGFINFTLSEAFLVSEMVSLIKKRVVISNKENKGKKAVVEYSSPNIAKPFTIGHLRSTIIGDSVANLFEAMGYEVFRDNHLGDWGTQFGKQIYALKNLGEGSLEANIKKISKATNPVKELVKLYVDFHDLAEEKPEIEDEARAIFKALEDGDQEIRELWQKCIDWSFIEFDRIYSRLGVSFTENNGRGYGESFFEDKMDIVIKELEERANKTGLIKYEEGDNGAMLVSFPKKSKLPPMMILKSDGATLYATRDLATDKWRLGEKYGKDTLIINEVGAEQSLYFKQLYFIEEALGWVKPGQRVHVSHGMYRFKDGKMSTRKGNVIWLEDVLDEAVAKATKLASEERLTSAQAIEKIAFGALKWSDLKRSSHLDVTFDWDEIMTMNGNSGPYMQYTYVRAQSILEKVKNLDITKPFDILNDIKIDENWPKSYKMSEVEKELLRNLYTYFEVVEKSALEFAPHHLTTYLFNLAQIFNRFYGAHKVIGSGEDKQVEEFRTLLVIATSMVIKKGLGLLGIEVVSKM